ncbi:MAG: hypothetical protein QTN59_19315 [Candidatus Electrothrix communis]|nr:MAG: hypothetical protein QTN59_19315 [Candidatus Electrothrix communis]
MKNKKSFFLLLLLCLFCMSCQSVFGEQFVADHTVATEDVLRSIPQEYIDAVRENLHIAYQHTSHGTHVSRGMFGLQDYKDGDDILFGIENHTVPGTPVEGKLNFYDYAIRETPATDLSVNETTFVQLTRDYLDAPGNAHINVMMWSWCDIATHDVGNYLLGMQTLIDEYGSDGSKVGSGPGQRQEPVTFIFMTGHANKEANTGFLQPKPQADLINNFSRTNGYFCLDYYNIDTHDMDGNYWEDAGDNGDSTTGGNFYQDWQDSHTLGQDWFENKLSPGGPVAYGQHNTQHITANRKAYAMWWILARIAGWSGNNSESSHSFNPQLMLLLLKNSSE